MTGNGHGLGSASRHDAVVVGAGAYGTAVAFHLVQAGLDVALVDRTAFVTQTSPRAAGLAVQVRTLEAFGRLARRSVEMLAGFEALTGEPLSIAQTGSLAIARTEAAEARVRAYPSLAARYDLDVRLVDADEARELAPYASYETARAIGYTPTDVHLEPGDLPRAYLRAARRGGLVALEGRDVLDVLTRDGRVIGIETDRGPVLADVVVNCAGGWLRAVAPRDLAAVPVQPVRHQLMVTEPLAGVDDRHASVRVVDANVYARPCWGGLMFGGYESAPAFLATERLPAVVTSLALDPSAIDELRARVPVEYPVLEGARVRELRGGVPTLTADGHPIIDEVREARGLFVIGGCNVGGLSTSPAIGEAVATWIATGARPAVLVPFGLDRFRGVEPDALLAQAREKYLATEYG